MRASFIRCTLWDESMFSVVPWLLKCRTVYPKKYAHGFVVLCFVVVMQSFIMNSHEIFIHIHQGCFAGTGAIVRLPQCQWSKPDGYGKISQCITTTKHSKAKIVCIFLGIYCIQRFIVLGRVVTTPLSNDYYRIWHRGSTCVPYNCENIQSNSSIISSISCTCFGGTFHACISCRIESSGRHIVFTFPLTIQCTCSISIYQRAINIDVEFNHELHRRHINPNYDINHATDLSKLKTWEHYKN